MQRIPSVMSLLICRCDLFPCSLESRISLSGKISFRNKKAKDGRNATFINTVCLLSQLPICGSQQVILLTFEFGYSLLWFPHYRIS